jgi:hypothetical protein
MLEKNKKLLREQESEVNSLTLNTLLYATIATLSVALISVGLRIIHLREINAELTFIPWAIAVVLGVSVAYRRGVESERKRQNHQRKEDVE